MSLNSIFWSALLWMTVALPCSATVFTNDFSNDPLANGWRVFGDANLFRWNSTNQNIDATWDSSKTNTYFYVPMGTVLTRSDDFSFALDLRLNDIAGGVAAGKTNAFELTFGFLNSASATKTNFFRGTGRNSPNLVEFAFFPDNGYGATVWPTIWSTNSMLNYNGDSDFTLLNLPVGVTMRISMAYTSSNRTLKTSITTNGISIGTINGVALSGSFTDFRVDTFALESYSDAFTTDSILARGSVDNISITVPPPPIQNLRGAFTNGQWNAEFLSRTNWLYTLERTTNFQSWSNVSLVGSGTGTNLILRDTNSILDKAFYRVRANRL